MKKQIMSLSAFALVILAAGCAKNEITPDISGGNNINTEQISFRSSTGKTRANDNGIAEVAAGFNVIGLKADGAYITGFAEPTTGGEAEIYWSNNGTWEWKTPPTGENKKWPTVQGDYPLNFFAAYPLSETVNATAPTAALEATPNIMNQTFQYNIYGTSGISVSGGTVTEDFLAAQSTVTTKPAQGFTDLNFKHIMSQLTFDIVVPAGFEANVRTIAVVNLMKNGRSYDYSTGIWGAAVAQEAGNTGSYLHNHGTAVNITSAAPAVPGMEGTLKLMPQTATTPWALSTFTTDAAAWKVANTGTAAEGITAWYESTVASGGMNDSEGWKGSRIEVVYNLIDVTNGKNIVGRKASVDGAAADQFVRVGYMLDLSTIDTKGDGTLMGLHPGYKYKFQIPLGTADATNGILLDPDFKDVDGGNTDKPVDNPTTTPGDPITKEGLINFKVAVDVWADYAGDIK